MAKYVKKPIPITAISVDRREPHRTCRVHKRQMQIHGRRAFNRDSDT